MAKKIIIGPMIGKPPADWTAEQVRKKHDELIKRGMLVAGQFVVLREQAETLAKRQSTGRDTRKRAAEAESDRRKREWLRLKREVACDRKWADEPERLQNGETDRRLAEWLTKRGTPVKASTIANQRSRNGWLDAG